MLKDSVLKSGEMLFDMFEIMIQSLTDENYDGHI